jgi:hypothetical protein
MSSREVKIVSDSITEYYKARARAEAKAASGRGR